MSAEPTNFLTLMNNGKAFSSFDGMACSYQCSDHFVSTRALESQLVAFLETLKKPANLFKNNLNNTRNNMKFQIQKKKNFSKKKPLMRAQELFLGKKIWEVFPNWRTYDQIMSRLRRSVVNDKYIFQ